MSAHTNPENVPHGGAALTPEAAARLRALARPRVDVRTAAKSIKPAEIASIVVLAVAIVGIVLVYAYSILPGQVQKAQLASAQRANQTKIEELTRQVHDPTSIEQEFQAVEASLTEFRGAYLKPRMAGRLAIVGDVDRLTHEAGVSLASPVTFSTALATAPDAKKPKNAPKREGASYSSLTVTFSVAGSFGRVLRFINEFERSDQFVVINSVSLAASEPAPAEPARRGRAAVAAAPVGDSITLQFSMTAYFQPDVDASGSAADEGAR